MATILVTGAAGLLGAHVAAALAPAHDVVGCDRHPWWGDEPLRMIRRDLLAPGAAAGVMAEVQPRVLVHCAAWVDVDACEQDPERAMARNAHLSGALARGAPPGCLMVLVSSDSVCQANGAGATEQDPPAPMTAYAKSKLAGERLVQAAAPEHLIVRTNFYGWSSGRKRTFGEWLYGALERRTPIRLFTDVRFTPIYAADLARRVARLIERGARGVVHVAGNDTVSKFQFGMLVARAAGLSAEAVTPSRLAAGRLAAPRAQDTSLASGRCEQLLGLPAPGCAEGIERFVRDRARPLSRRVSAREEAAQPAPASA